MPGERDLADQQAPNLSPPPGNPRFPLFDGLRAIAALSVFLGHTITGLYLFSAHPGRFLTAVQLAYQGVAIFFLISGFLLYRPFVAARGRGERVGLSAYARRRVLRIVPAYWVALSLCLLAGLVSGVTTSNWWVFYGFGQIYSSSLIGRGIGVAWTLCIEVTFYAALPLFVLALDRLAPRRRGVRVEAAALVVLAAGSLAWRAHFSGGIANVAALSTLPATFTWFALGMGLALASVAGHGGVAARRLRLAAAPELAWVLALAFSALEYELIRHAHGVSADLVTYVIYGLVALFVLLPGVFADGSRRPVVALLRSRGLAYIGLISYAFYLYHSVLIDRLDHWFGRHAGSARYPLVLAGSFLLTVAVASASYYALERPLMRWGRRRRARPQPAE